MAGQLGFARGLVSVITLLTAAVGCTATGESAADAAADAEGGAPKICTDANVQLIQASNYDQSCKSASDCIAVGVGNACYPCEIACPSAAINADAKGQYLSDVAKTSAADLTGVNCGCPLAFNPCCRGGTCHADFQCQNPNADAAGE